MEIRATNKIALVAVLIGVAALMLFIYSGKNFPAEASTGTIIVDATGLRVAPDLQGISGYINTQPGLSLEDLRGKVVLIDFWTFSCINCIRTLPYLRGWHEKYADDGLVIIGVHSPEFEFEKDTGNVMRAVEKYGIEYPVVQDNDFATWRAYENRFWPHKFLIDAEGHIRYDHIGEGAYEETEMMIVELLRERDSNVEMGESSQIVEDTDFAQIGTPEIYLGIDFARAPLGNEEGFSFGEPFEYVLPEEFIANLAYFGGTWQTFGDYSQMVSESGEAGLNYKAKNLNIVAGSQEGSMLKVFVDGKALDENNAGEDAVLIDGEWLVPVREQKLYNLVAGENYGQKTVVFLVEGTGLELYTFTFG